jgi:hypothetical protein
MRSKQGRQGRLDSPEPIGAIVDVRDHVNMVQESWLLLRAGFKLAPMRQLQKQKMEGETNGPLGFLRLRSKSKTVSRDGEM